MDYLGRARDGHDQDSLRIADQLRLLPSPQIDPSDIAWLPSHLMTVLELGYPYRGIARKTGVVRENDRPDATFDVGQKRPTFGQRDSLVGPPQVSTELKPTESDAYPSPS